MDCRSTVGDELDPLDRRSRYRADIDHALRTAVSKPVAIEQRQCGAGPDAPQVEGRCPVDVDVLVLCALPRTDTGVLAAAEILRQAARNLAEIGVTAIADIFARDADHRGCGRGCGDPAAGHDDVFLRRTAPGLR